MYMYIDIYMYMHIYMYIHIHLWSYIYTQYIVFIHVHVCVIHSCAFIQICVPHRSGDAQREHYSCKCAARELSRALRVAACRNQKRKGKLGQNSAHFLLQRHGALFTCTLLCWVFSAKRALCCGRKQLCNVDTTVFVLQIYIIINYGYESWTVYAASVEGNAAGRHVM